MNRTLQIIIEISIIVSIILKEKEIWFMIDAFTKDPENDFFKGHSGREAIGKKLLSLMMAGLNIFFIMWRLLYL